MSKLTLKSVSNLSSTEMETALTSNFNSIEDAVDDCLSRTGKLPNHMEADLDMNGRAVVNVKDPVSDTDAATKGYVDSNTTDVVWKGVWSVGTEYNKLEAVHSAGSSYICTVAHTSSSDTEPGVGANWSSCWDLMAEKGAAGPAGLDGIGITWKAAWSAGTNYSLNDAVKNNGTSYICTAAHTSDAASEPGTGASWTSYWDVVAEKGDTGPTGPQGPIGPQGPTGPQGPQGDSVNWRGTWTAGTAYNILDAVEDGGSSYICTVAHTSSTADEPGAGASWSSYWDLMAQKGVDGTGAGDVSGPSVSTTGNFASFADNTGKLLADSGYSSTSFITDTADSVTSTHIVAGAVGTNEIADGAVTTIKIPDAAVTPAKLDSTGAYTVDSLTVTTTLLRGTSTIWGDDNFAARIAALTANASPTGKESVACDDGQRVTLQDIANLSSGGGFNPSFISGALAYTSAANTNQYTPHGLSSVPRRFGGYIKCLTAELGYSVGDIVPLYDDWPYYNLYADATNVGFLMAVKSFYVVNKGSPSTYGIPTSANWELYFWAEV